MAPIAPNDRWGRARVYRRIQYRRTLISYALSALYLTALIAGGSRWLGRIAAHPVLYVAALFLGLALVGLPADCYGHLQARRAGLSNERTGSWLVDQMKGILVALLIQVVLAGGLLWLWTVLPRTWHFWTAAVAVAVDLTLVLLTPGVILPWLHTYAPLADEEIKARLRSLCERAGIPVQGVYVSEVRSTQSSWDAVLTGLGPARRIILSDTILEACTPEEIEVVISHELGHHRHRHLQKRSLGTAMLLGAGILILGYALPPLSALLGLGGLTKEALPLLGGLVILLGLPLLPALLALARHWERIADAFALQLTGNPEAYVSVMKSLAVINLVDLAPPRWVYYFQYAHPTIPERIALAERRPRSA